jgi:dTDP-4-dehydrorhamnose reductase
MKVLITGAGGQLGFDLCRILNNADISPLTHAESDVTDINSVRAAFKKCLPDVAINTAAYVRVDDCESNQAKAFSVNALGAANMAIVAQEFGAKLVHISTDYVFGGEKEPRSEPYTETDQTAPLNVYGMSKLTGEQLALNLCRRCFIVRSSGLFGIAGSSGKGGNFVETMLGLGKKMDELKVVNDQKFSPTYTWDLAKKIAQLIPTESYGVFHVTNSGECTWYEFTIEILKIAGLSAGVIPLTSEQYPQKARRPHYSVLGNRHLKLLGMDDMRHWREALVDYITEKRLARPGRVS